MKKSRFTTSSRAKVLPCERAPEVWHSKREDAVEMAVRGCMSCPLMAACRDYALSRDEPYGTWGGSTETDRQSAREIRTSREGQMLTDVVTAA